jgi:hypothetical protein
MADDEVTIIKTGSNGESYSQSWLQADLSQGQSTTIDGVTITADTINIGANPGYATVTFEKGTCQGNNPTSTPTKSPTSSSPVGNPTSSPVGNPTSSPVGNPTSSPVGNPTSSPVGNPTASPAGNPTASPVGNPTASPVTAPPTKAPTADDDDDADDDDANDDDGECSDGEKFAVNAVRTKTCNWLANRSNANQIKKFCEKKWRYDRDGYGPPNKECRLTCDPYVSSCDSCFEYSKSKFFLKKSKKNKNIFKSCNWLSSKSENKKNQVCNQDSTGSFPKANVICPQTCNNCNR